MARKATLVAGLVGGVVAATGVWTLYQRARTETVPYTVVASVDDVELRRYPALVTVETEADSSTVAFRRLFRYISGANERGADIEMTAPVERTSGTGIPMTAPVEIGERATETATTPGERAGTRMSFYLPSDYDVESAPTPTDDAVELVLVPERTLAIRRFSGRPTDRRVARERERLVETLDEASVDTTGSPFLMGYDAPWTLPPVRRNEVAVEVSD